MWIGITLFVLATGYGSLLQTPPGDGQDWIAVDDTRRPLASDADYNEASMPSDDLSRELSSPGIVGCCCFGGICTVMGGGCPEGSTSCPCPCNPR